MTSLKSMAALKRCQLTATTSLWSGLNSLSLSPKPVSSLDKNDKNASFSRNFNQGTNSLSPSSHNQHVHLGRVNPFHSSMLTSSHIDTDNRQYICPSRISHLLSQLVIGDSLNDIKSFYDCPIANNTKTEIITPAHQSKEEVQEPPCGHSNTSKEAKEIMRIRHKKMKKHKLRKLRKRMYFLWKKQKAARKAKRDTIYWKEIADIKQQAEDFNAESFVKEQLEKARKGGFYLKVLNSDSDSKRS